MKLIIQIPCYNEEKTLPLTLKSLPRHVPGFDEVEWLVIDDGSRDDTVRIAREAGVDHIARHTGNKGLARAFMTGLDAALSHGADVIVNTDADNQYSADDIPALVKPILEGRADIVVGARPINTITHFSWIKKLLQKLGSWVVRVVSKTDIPDAASGFRAMSANAAQQLVVFNDYTYTLETIIQAGQKNIAITWVPIHVNDETRKSRLFRSIFSYVWRSATTIIRVVIIYRPFAFFGAIAIILFGAGFLIGLYFVWLYLTGEGQGHVQLLILAAILMIIGFQTGLIAFVADLQAANRRLLESMRVTKRAGLKQEWSANNNKFKV